MTTSPWLSNYHILCQFLKGDRLIPENQQNKEQKITLIFFSEQGKS
jgi:hypothetical protein